MRALLICPDYQASLASLLEEVPLACVRFASTSVVECWLEHLAVLGATEVLVLASDRPEHVRRVVGDGARWGLSASVFPERRALTPEDAIQKHPSSHVVPWLDHPHRAIVMDHLPGGRPGSLIASYDEWFQSIRCWIRRSPELLPAEVREVRPGVFIGARARVSPGATLMAPCWVGPDSRIGPGAVIGPDAVIESHVSIGAHCVVRRGWVGSETLVGAGLLIEDSLATRDQLIHCPSSSVAHVADTFLLQPLRKKPTAQAGAGWFGRLVALLLLVITAPIAVLGILMAKLKGQPALRILTAVRARSGQRFETFLYAELTAFRGGFRRIPQLWNVLIGDFRWVGPPPVSPSQAAQLTTEFERLCLRGPIGLLAPENTGTPSGDLTEEAIAWASCYAVHPNWRGDGRVVAATVMGRRRVDPRMNLAGRL